MNHLFERRVLNFSLRVLLDGEKLIDIWKISRYIKKKVNKIKGNFFVKISTFYIYTCFYTLDVSGNFFRIFFAGCKRKVLVMPFNG